MAIFFPLLIAVPSPAAPLTLTMITTTDKLKDAYVVFRKLGESESDGIHVSLETRERLEGTPDTDLVVPLDAVKKSPAAKVYID